MVSSLSDQFKGAPYKTYLAVVKICRRSHRYAAPFPSKGWKDQPLAYRRTKSLGDLPEMNYRVLASSDSYHLLEVQLITGRHPSDSGAIGGHWLSPIKGM
ncbi:MAG: hypothetical protein IPN76_33795 [Saprospiraceae bacterium]|nr:hypothetical protein [Saprospiraceae bacterium]